MRRSVAAITLRCQRAVDNWDQPPGVAFHVVDGNRISTHFRVA